MMEGVVMKLRRLKSEDVKRAMAWDLSHVRKRYQKETKTSEKHAKLLEHELKRFLIVAADTLPEYIAMSGPVDAMWHTFIIHTAEYSKFCDQLCGRMIHHSPTKAGETAGKLDKYKDPYSKFLLRYKEIFEEKAPFKIWPISSVLNDGIGDATVQAGIPAPIPAPPPPPPPPAPAPPAPGPGPGPRCNNRPPSEEGTDPDQDTDSDIEIDIDTDKIL